MKKYFFISGLIICFIFAFGFLYSLGECISLGSCDSLNQGICLDEGVGNLTSFNCSRGCSGNTCFEDNMFTTYDSLGRVTSVDYEGTENDIFYQYYGSSSSIIKILISNPIKETYTYDTQGNLLSEEYSENPEDNKYYFYYPNDYLQDLFNSNSFIHYTYYPSGLLKSEEVTGYSTYEVTEYRYYPNNLTSEIITLDKKQRFFYDAKDRLVREEVLRQASGGEYQTIEGVNYTYDENDNIIAMLDDTGFYINFGYERYYYDCEEVQCLAMGCTPGSECYTLYENIGGILIPYNCSNITFITKVCNYTELISKNFGNFWINITNITSGELSSENWDESYVPDIQYDAEGYLAKYDELFFNYTENHTELEQINANSSVFETLNVGFGYTDDYLSYLEGQTDLGDSTTVFFYDVLGEPIKEVYYLDDDICPGGATGCAIGGGLRTAMTGNIIKDFFFRITGKVVSEDEGTVFYHLSSGSKGSRVSKEDYLNLINPSIVWPELAPYVAGLLNEDGTLNESRVNPSCYDEDNSDVSIYNFGYVRDGAKVAYDSCLDNNTLVEYKCRRTFFGLGKPKMGEYSQICENGCYAGACIVPSVPFNPTCSDGIQNGNETGIDCGGECKSCLDLPPTPTKPNNTVSV